MNGFREKGGSMWSSVLPGITVITYTGSGCWNHLQRRIITYGRKDPWEYLRKTSHQSLTYCLSVSSAWPAFPAATEHFECRWSDWLLFKGHVLRKVKIFEYKNHTQRGQLAMSKMYLINKTPKIHSHIHSRACHHWL